MKYTNKLDLPPAMVEALTYDDYNAGIGHYTPSSLNMPVYMKKLLDAHGDELVVDVVENFHLMMGKAVHKVLETTEAKSWREVRVYSQIGKWLVSMQLDNFWLEKGWLQDYKNTTVYKFTKDFDGCLPEVPEWSTQLNIGGYILRNSPMIEQDGRLVPMPDAPEVRGLEIIGLLKDWSKTKASRDKKYPQTPIYRRPIPFWTDAEVERYVVERAALHDRAKDMDVNQINPCSEDEVWAKPTVYAVMKNKTAKKSSGNFTSLYEAENKARTMPGAFVETRPSERPRCAGYCHVGSNNLCPFYENWKNQTQ